MSERSPAAALGLVSFLAAWTSWAPAQPCDWLPGEGMPGTDGSVYCATTWDPDGAGPEPELLIVGGDFTTAGDVFAHRIAAWNGTAWQSLGSGIMGHVYTLTVYNGDLIAGGSFTTAGGVTCNHIARWNGSTWQALGSGMNDPVRALTTYAGALVAGGHFTTAGAVTCNYIARWNGSAWQPLGSGMSVDSGFPPEVDALGVYDGELIAGGWFTSAGGVACNVIARWDGGVWQPLGGGLGGGMTSWVYGLTIYNGELIAGGRFAEAGGVQCNNVARWDGAIWRELGGWDPWWGPGTHERVYGLTVHAGELVAGGEFTSAGGVTCNHVGRWNGSIWQALGWEIYDVVLALTVHSAELIAGGEFTTAGGATCKNLSLNLHCVDL